MGGGKLGDWSWISLMEKGGWEGVHSTKKGQVSQSPILAHGAGLPDSPFFFSGSFFPFSAAWKPRARRKVWGMWGP